MAVGSPYQRLVFPHVDDNDGYDSDFEKRVSTPVAFVSPVSPTVVNIRASTPATDDAMDVVADASGSFDFDFDFDEAVNSASFPNGPFNSELTQSEFF